MIDQLAGHVGVLADSVFHITPSGNAPGAAGLQKVVDTFAFYAFVACGLGFVSGIAMWAAGGYIGNDYTAQRGKTGVVVALGAAFILGAANTLLNWAYKAS